MLKYTFKFIETNNRLEERKHKSKTIELSRDLFDHYDVDGMIRAFNSAIYNYIQRDSKVTIKAIKVGRTEFQL